MPLIDSTPTSIITEASVNNDSVEERQRREEAIKNIDYYYSKQEKYVSQVNMDVDLVTINILAPIIKKKLSLLYSRPLKREFEGPTKSIGILEGIYDDIDMDNFLLNVDLAAELTGTGLVFVGLDDTGKVKLRMYDASEISIVDYDEDPNSPLAVSIVSLFRELVGTDKDPQVEKVLRTQVWTDDYVTIFQGKTEKSQEPNKLGFLPFVSFRGEEVYNQFLGHAPAEALQQLNGYINQQLTNLGYMIKMESATPIVIKGYENGEGITVHPGNTVSLPLSAEASVLNMNPKIKETLEEIKYLEQKLFETSGVPKVSVVGDETANSGRELLIRWAPLMQIFNSKTLRYKKYELQLANMILKVLGEEPIENVIVSYPEEKLLPLQDNEDRDTDIRYGLITPVDELLKQKPSLSEEEAEVVIRSNIEFNKAVSQPVVQPEVDPLEKEV